MTTPQPSNQLPEEVKPSAITPSSFIVYPLWLWHDETGEALPRGWTRRHHGTFSGTGLLNMGFTHWHPDQPTAPTGTPYLAPRPPAPRDAEWAKAFDPMTGHATAELANAFLRWPLPETVRVDACCLDVKAKNRTGTNLLSVVEALQLMQQVVCPIILRHAPADSASAQLAAITADRDEWKADSERLKAREVTLTDRQCLVQLAFTESGFNYESGEGLPELAKRVAGMASAYRARDNIGMSREEYHKAKDALGQLAAMREERDELNRRLVEQHKLYCEETKRHNETWAKIHAATGYLNKEFKKLPEDLLEAVKEVVFRVTLVELGRNSLQDEVAELRDKRKQLIEKLRESVNDTRELNDLAEALVAERTDLRAQLAAAQSEVGRLTKERDEANEESRIACNQREADIKENANLSACLTTAEAALVEARKDKERLDWLLAQNPEVWLHNTPFKPAGEAAQFFLSHRAALDSARAKINGEEGG